MPEYLTLEQAKHRNELVNKLIGFYSAQHGCCNDYIRALITTIRVSTYDNLRAEYELVYRTPVKKIE